MMKMTEKYILVTDEEYCYTLDTQSDDYKTLGDFEKQEFENAKKDNVDVKEYEDAILQLASDKYWDWVYENHLEADNCNDIMNELVDENEQLKQQLAHHTRMHEWFRNEAYLLQNKLDNREDEIRRLKGDD